MNVALSNCLMANKSLIIKVRPEKREEFQQTIFSLQSERKEGCVEKMFMIAQDSEDQNVFHVTYYCKSNHESKIYLDSEQHRVFLGALKTLCEKVEYVD
jgi:hypothetical protein